MMTPKMKEDFCTQILGASRQLFLSGRISEICREKGTQKQLEFILELLQAELTLRDENRRKRLIKRAGFPTYKTFEGYSYHCVKFPPAFSREELETLEFVPGKKNLVLYGPVRSEERRVGREGGTGGGEEDRHNITSCRVVID